MKKIPRGKPPGEKQEIESSRDGRIKWLGWFQEWHLWYSHRSLFVMVLIVFLCCLALTIEGLPIEPSINAETTGGAFEGDMIFPPNFNPRQSTRGAAVFGADNRWPSNTVPYDLTNITNSEDRRSIVEAMNTLMGRLAMTIGTSDVKRLCVLFRPAQPTDKYVLRARYGDGCSASVGFNTRFLRELNLKPVDCFQSGTIQHELLHVLGFYHEQSRADRDSYVTVNFDNIISDSTHNFDKYQWNERLENQGFPYDYSSIMHYGTDYFTKNGQPTIVPRDPKATIGLRAALSEIDVAENQSSALNQGTLVHFHSETEENKTHMTDR